ncbi:antibiotic biosynthesis monooxygenase [Rhodoblastus sp.]|jgi:heme-degrading monooxygenase HmoA|uniref:antibiotic biosynthesis monooxygenase family protein n=1 Tax=Rhodoblastus sp. TaxID=1962975 RepID=UPI0025D61A43|nr:antibiotic biosynthesis monooxygenase [Rhodoblastus sp.]
MTFIAMNRFRVALGREAEFETIWRNRQSDLPSMPGFVVFQLLRGPSDEQATLFVSHTIWETRGDFEEWTRSEAFRRAHSGAPKTTGLYLGPPQFEGFEAVMETTRSA